MGEGRYQVVWPAGRRALQRVARAAREADLDGRTVCELWDLMFRGETIYPQIRRELAKRYPRVRFAEYGNFGNIHGAHQTELVSALPDALRRNDCGAVIAGIGA